MLCSLGYTVYAAGSPSAAIRLAEEHASELRLMLSDVVMPEMNGRELAKAVAELCPGLSCVFVSGYTADIITHRGVLNDGVHFLAKPFSRSELAETIQAALRC